MDKAHRDELVHSYTRVRLALGLLGFVMPFILILGGMFDHPRPNVNAAGIEPTISDFYHTIYRDVFVGSLCAIGVFLVSYRGYRREPGEFIDDDWLATLAGVAAFGVAFFPNNGGGAQVASMMQGMVGTSLAEKLHYAFAFVFFSCLAAMCFWKFARTTIVWRRRVYRACGAGIVLALILTMIAVYFRKIVGGDAQRIVEENNLIFWFETLGIWCFAISWIVKSKADVALLDKLKTS